MTLAVGGTLNTNILINKMSLHKLQAAVLILNSNGPYKLHKHYDLMYFTPIRCYRIELR